MICVSSISVYPKSISIKVGEWYNNACAEVRPANATCPCVTWWSSNQGVATVNPDTGLIYGMGVGTAVIYAKAQDGSGHQGTCVVTVSQTVKASSIEMNIPRLTLEKGRIYTLCATVYPTNAENRNVSWRTDSPGVATVNQYGVVTAHRAGRATIYASTTDGTNLESCCVVTVTEDILVGRITVSPSSKSMKVGGSAYLSVSISPSNATCPCVTWRSDNPGVATVNADSGLVVARSVGKATIYAETQDGTNLQSCCVVTVVSGTVLVETVTVSPSSRSMEIGDTVQLTATVCPANAAEKYVMWWSSEPSVAAVDIYGVVTAQNAGTAVIYAATTDGTNLQSCCTVTVKGPVPVSSVTVCPLKEIITICESAKLTVDVYPSNATNKDVIWSSSNPEIASVGKYSGIITARQLGTVTITATTVDGGYSASAQVIVKRESVTISKSSVFNKVVFESSGKTWECLNHDTIYDEKFLNNALHYDISNKNFYVDFPNNNVDIKYYTDEEIKLLYAIDPYGVADYVNRYGKKILVEKSLEDSIRYKDYIFELLFNRKPRYFARNIEGTWYITDRVGPARDLVSESETIFGMHNVFDTFTLSTVLEIISSIADTIVGVIISLMPPVAISEYLNVVEVATYLFLSMFESDENAKKELQNSFFDEGMSLFSEKFYFEWAYNIISIADSISDIGEAMSDIPDIYRPALNYCANDINYDVYMELKNGVRYKADEINQALSYIE